MKVGKSPRACWYFLLALVLTSGLHAQTNTDRILGSVKDQSGGAVGAAAVTVTEADRGAALPSPMPPANSWFQTFLPATTRCEWRLRVSRFPNGRAFSWRSTKTSASTLS
jgi:hypothetical protein